VNFKKFYEIVRDARSKANITFEKDYLPFICSRGVAVKRIEEYFIYLIYPRQEKYFQMKKHNRSGTQLHKVRFEIFYSI
jgi:hypothetical protein